MLKVGLRQTTRRPAEQVAAPLLDPRGAAVIVGGADPHAASVLPAATTLFGPRGAALAGPAGPLWVADTGHHRLLGWAERPREDGVPADWVLGQPDFTSEGRNALGEPSASTLNVPSGLTLAEGGLAVADSWNNRVLIWHERPAQSGVPADVVLGQADFSGQRPNRDRPDPAADTLHWPFGVAIHEGRLIVADAGNRRVLIWNEVPRVSAQPADVVLGQADFTSRSDNGGGEATWRSFRYPHDVAILEGDLVVADAGNNRVLRFAGVPRESNVAAQALVGQRDALQVDHNLGEYWPGPAALNMPYALTSGEGLLVVADTANSRLLGWPGDFAGAGSDAQSLSAQPDFRSKGDNRWGFATRDSICWPYGLQLCQRTCVVSDTGNHRVLLWELA